MPRNYTTKEEIFNVALWSLDKSLRDLMSPVQIEIVEQELNEQGSKRKGYFGNLVEQFIFDLEVNNRSEADFKEAGVELKTTPLKLHKSKGYVAKERLVFSMIDYMSIIDELWESSSFLEKNKLVLIMFYIFEKSLSILDYKVKFIYDFDILNKISANDVLQIRQDWEHIVNKVRRGEAHLLSEGETFYLAACTKSANSLKLRKQPNSEIMAKPRAFSLKQKYLNYILHSEILRKDEDIQSMSAGVMTIDDTVKTRLAPFVGMSDDEIIAKLQLKVNRKAKQYKRMLANSMLGISVRKVEEFEKANVTMKVITLECDGKLKESLPFPYFKFKSVVKQPWDKSRLYKTLETKRFLFVVFKKDKLGDKIYFEGFKFWNFPMKDIDEVKNVWDKTISLIRAGQIVKETVVGKKGKTTRVTNFPGLAFNGIAHVRPHAKDSFDVATLPVMDKVTGENVYTKHCFWLNAKYIKKELGI